MKGNNIKAQIEESKGKRQALELALTKAEKGKKEGYTKTAVGMALKKKMADC